MIDSFGITIGQLIILEMPDKKGGKCQPFKSKRLVLQITLTIRL